MLFIRKSPSGFRKTNGYSGNKGANFYLYLSEDDNYLLHNVDSAVLYGKEDYSKPFSDDDTLDFEVRWEDTITRGHLPYGSFSQIINRIKNMEAYAAEQRRNSAEEITNIESITACADGTKLYVKIRTEENYQLIKNRGCPNEELRTLFVDIENLIIDMNNTKEE